jgi:hypothetical protein
LRRAGAVTEKQTRSKLPGAKLSHRACQEGCKLKKTRKYLREIVNKVNVIGGVSKKSRLSLAFLLSIDEVYPHFLDEARIPHNGW